MQQKTFDLNTLNGANGFTVPGSSLGSMAGDINGDGIGDLVLGAQAPGSANGISYVIFGNRLEFPSSFNLTSLNGTNGFTVPGVAPGGFLGQSVSTAGDINGDGISDLVLGVPGANGYGTSYVIFGNHRGFVSSFNLASLNGSNGFTILGIAPYDGLGGSVSTVGDINGDGISDLVLGAPGGSASPGVSYVIFGNRQRVPPSFDLTRLNGTNGFTIPGVDAIGQLGASVKAAGDINGDGISDLVLGAPRANSDAGVSYVIFGSRGGFVSSFNLNNLNGINGFTVPGIVASGYLGRSVSSAGDINGDGIDDLVLGANGVSSQTGSIQTGTSYVIFGNRTGFGSFFDLTSLNGTNGFTISGIAPYDSLGGSVSTVGDINGDGISDLVLGAYGANSYAGASYVIFGSHMGFSSVSNLTNLNGTNGFIVPGVELNAQLGTSVSTAGDINGDGISDLVLCALWADLNAGTSYVIFGGLPSIKLIKNELVITQGQTVVLTSENLSVVGLVPFNSMAFTVSRIQGGWFAFVNNPATAIFNFTQSQINLGQVQFVSDRSASVTYQVGIYNVTDGRFALLPTSADVTFINYAPKVINAPLKQEIIVNQPFNFLLAADQIFNDPDGDPLAYSAQLSDGSALPSWMHFDTSRANELAFSGTDPSVGGTEVRLFAKDPLNANVSTEFEILAVPNNGTSINIFNASTAQIAGSVLGGLVGLAGLMVGGFGFWRYAKDKNSRQGEQFANHIRETLNLKRVENFKDSENGKKYVAVVHSLVQALEQVGIDPSLMRPGELHELANDVATAARRKITAATDCLGRSEITISDLNDNMQSIVTEVQVLRSHVAQQRNYTNN